MKRTLLLVPVLFLGACASNEYCMKPQDYQAAADLPPLKSAGALRVPETPSALHVPPPPENAVPFGVRNAEGKPVCLDQPPHLDITQAHEGDD